MRKFDPLKQLWYLLAVGVSHFVHGVKPPDPLTNTALTLNINFHTYTVYSCIRWQSHLRVAPLVSYVTLPTDAAGYAVQLTFGLT